ncbi:translocation and assembly module TamB [Rheinheimera pacifica]|uniref:autotransporter assembly complex protein TamB n=1 Tax=Rheinheimera pacifica TaxID=173990 RepID=UPI0021680591|nr:translocation/assembly module TamB domain-containing protein [Rheinheimera pacifica]MCS4307317.1 translocation and assembly module TamB [Rheinheimera pacifica]
MSWQTTKRWLKRSLKWLNWTLVIPCAALTLLLFTLLYTSAGLRFNLWLAQHFVSGFSVERSEGSVLGGNTLYDLRWQDASTSLALEQSTLQINNSCFLRLTLCIEQLTLQGLQLEITTTDTPAPEDEPDSTGGLWLPFAIDIAQLQLNNANVAVSGTTLNWQQFSTGAQLWGNKVQLNQPHWHKVTLALPESSNTQGSDTATSDPFAYQAPVLTDIRLPLSLFVDRFRLTDFTLQQPEPQTINELTFSLQMSPEQINLTQLDISHPMATLNASARLQPSGNYPLKADIRLRLLDTELAGQRLRVTLDGTLADLQLQAYARELLEAELSLWLNLLDNTLPLRASLNAAQLQWPLSGQADIELSQLDITANGNLEQLLFSSQVALDGKQIPAANIQLSGQSSLTGVTLDSLIVNTLGGELSAEAELSWQQQLSWLGKLQLTKVQPGQFWPDYNGELNGKMQLSGNLTEQGGWQLALPQLDLNGTLRDYKLLLEGSLNAADPSGQGDYQLNTPGLTLRHAKNQIQLSGSLDKQWQLAMKIAIPELEQTISGASGEISADFRLSGKRDTPQLKGTLHASDLKWQDASLEQLTLDTDLSLSSEQNLTTALTLQATNGRYQQQSIDQLNLSLNGTELRHQLTLELASPEHNASIALSGSLKAGEYWQGRLVSAQLDSLLGPWQLVDSAALDYRFANARLTIQPHCWQQEPANLCAIKPLKLSAEHIELDLALQQFTLSALDGFLPHLMTLQGSADAQVSANWQQGQQPQAQIKLNGSSGNWQYQIEQPLALGWQNWQLEANLAKDTLTSVVQLQLDNNASLKTEATITDVQSSSRNIEGKLLLQQFSLAFLQPLLEQSSELAGILNSELHFNGDLTNPAINGNLALSGFKLAGRQAPLDVTDANIELQFAGQQATLQGLVTTSKGEINLNGDAQWPQLDNWQAALQVKGDELSLQIPQARLQVAPDLTLTARPGLTSLKGTVQIPAARISIDSLPQTAIGLSNDLVLLDEHLQPIPAEEKTAFALQTDINVVLGRRVQLSAFGLETRLSGNLRVRQQPNQQPTVNGDVNLQDGTFRAYGQDLLIRQGKMSFNGPSDQPFLNVEAIRNPDNIEDDVIAGIRVTGPADEPTITIFSEPAKPQANALAYLLMGRDIGSDSGSTGAALTTSLIGMSISSTGALVGELGEVFGVRDLTLDTAGAGDDSQVTVSGYLSRDLQIKYGYGIFNAIGEFTLRYRLMRSLYLEAVTSLDNAVDLLYKFEFD